MSDGGDFDDGGGDFDGPYIEETEEGLGARLQSSCGGICIGILLFLGSFPLLYWNEGRAVERYDTLEEGQGLTLPISVGSIDSSNDGKLVHFVSEVSSGNATLTDPIFGVVTNDLKLSRSPQLYQWHETSTSTTKDTLTGGKKTVTEYSYYKEWSEVLISSSNFKEPNGHQNPSSMPFEYFETQQDPIYVGAFELPDELIGRINWWQSYRDVNVSQIPDAALRNKTKVLQNGGGFFVGTSESSPQVGDSIIDFDTVKSGTISVIAQQRGNSFKSFQAEAGGTLLLFKEGNFTASEMFAQAEAENAALTWILRFVGFLVMALGLYLIVNPIAVLADAIPILGEIVECGLIFLCVLIAGVLSGIIISVAWLIHHPVIGAIILGGIIGGVCLIAFLYKKFIAKPKPPSSEPSKPAQSANAYEEDIPVNDVERQDKPGGDFANALG